MVTFKCKYSFFIWLKEKKNNSHSFLNVHDGQTVLVHGTNAELVSWLQQKKTNNKLGLMCTGKTGQQYL